jgi:site-specific recombinase XerD
MPRPEYIEEKKRKRLFENTLADPQNGIRDHALLRMMFGSFIRSIELIRLKTGLLVTEAGVVQPNEDLVIPPEISFNGRERPMPLSNPVLIDSIQRWINYRVEKKWGVTSSGFIDLDTPLFMSKRNIAFGISTKYNGDSVKHNCVISH